MKLSEPRPSHSTDWTRGRTGDVVRPSVRREAVPHVGHLPATGVHHPRYRRYAHQPALVWPEPDPAGGRRGSGPRARGADLHHLDATHLVCLRPDAAAHQVLPDAARRVRASVVRRGRGGRADPSLLAHHRQIGLRARRVGDGRQHHRRRAAVLLVGLRLLLAQV